MQIPKPTEDDKAYFRSIVPAAAGVEVKAMFGNLGAFVNGNMFAGLFGADIGVRLADADRERLLAQGGGPFGPEERPMGGYVTLPVAVRDDPGTGATWMRKALDHVGAMPPKQRKPSTRRPTRS